RLTAWRHICLRVFRHLAQKSLDIRQYACGISVRSDEKPDGASAPPASRSIALSLKGQNILPLVILVSGVQKNG
ncbi:MAG: hypothetical protein IJ740_18375, partial [Ruminococcus sp.]|nr:hypothetical protein [Ruminococcus sp.]